MDGEQEYFEAGAWNSAKVEVFKEEFFRFLAHVKVNSKDDGVICLGDKVYRAQQRFLDGIFEGLSQNIHDFKVLKSRQLGISTMSRALTLFWIGIHPGLKGYMIFDTAPHKEEARLELMSMIEGLPDFINFPKVKRDNRDLVQLSNGSTINFTSAGVRSSKSSGTLGRSSGVNFTHNSEVCSWDNTEGLESFKNSLSDIYPDRLYIWESTARGFNQWHDIWQEARLDSAHQRCIFIGWWAKDSQIILRGTPDFERYGVQPPSDKELRRIAEVKTQYGWDITDEQLAWVRRKMDPTAVGEGDAPAEFEGDGLRVQEQPWTESDAFQQTGSTFFDPDRLTELSNTSVSNKYKTYSYSAGLEFTDCRIYPSPNQRSTELKVWEEREDDATYVIAADVAFGANEKNDRSAIQVMRAYADGLDQVAEYAWPLINSMQFAWVIASLLGYYAGNTSQVYLIIELNGPGEATWNELQTLKRQLAMNYFLKDEVEDRGLRQMFFNVRNYIYGRSDSMSAGHNYQWRTTERLKVTIMERLRDFISNKMIRIRSSETVTEMRSITREGDSIEAEGNKKDDRVLALAFAIRCWEERVRRTLIGQKKTRERESAKKRMTIKDQVTMYNNAQLDQFFAVKQRNRARALADAKRAAWRGR